MKDTITERDRASQINQIILFSFYKSRRVTFWFAITLTMLIYRLSNIENNTSYYGALISNVISTQGSPA